MKISADELKKKDNEISLLRCLVEKMEIPEHEKSRCGTNKCDRCNWNGYAEEYLKLNQSLFWMEEFIK